jgi:hypothetical protein
MYEGLSNCRRSLQSPKKNIQHFKHEIFFSLVFVGQFFFLDPDQDSQSGSGSRDPIESGSETLNVPTGYEKDLNYRRPLFRIRMDFS